MSRTRSETDVSSGIRLDLVGESGTYEFGEGIEGGGDDEGIEGLEWMFG